MSKELIFSSEEFNDVRTTVDQNGTPLFCAHDVAKALGYSNFKKAIRTHCKRSVILKTNTSQGLQDLNYSRARCLSSHHAQQAANGTKIRKDGLRRNLTQHS